MAVLAHASPVPAGTFLTHAELIEVFQVGANGGIRFTGRESKPTQVVVISSQPGSFVDRPDRRRPYEDRWEAGVLRYTGEGKSGDQQLTKGNLALYLQPAHKHPVFLVEQVAPNRYQYAGLVEVHGVTQEIRPGEDDVLRRVYVFHLMKAL